MNTLTYHEFERITACVKDLLKTTVSMYDIIDNMEITHELYYQIVKLHNTAVDYMDAYENFKTKEVNGSWHILKRLQKRMDGKR